MKVVIVGGVAGGATAAARMRRLDENAEITVFERSGFVSYANCGLPYYVGGVIKNPGELTLQTPKSFMDRFRVDVRVNHEVTDIDVTGKSVTVKDLTTGAVFEESYDKLLLSPGARPVRPEFSGTDSENIFTLRTVEDTFRLRDAVTDRSVKHVVIAGGGYIGIEVAENLTEKGIDVTIVQRPPQLLAPLDRDMASIVHAKLREKGVVVKTGSSVEGFEHENGKVRVLLKGEAALEADMVVLAIGVRPDTALAEKAGLKTGIKGSIVVNDRMETSASDVYAVGDAVQVENSVTGEDDLISLAGPANKQGRIAADNICGGDSRYRGSQGSSVIKLFDLTIATTGINEKKASAAGLEYDRVVLSPASHATYYPGAKSMVMKVLFEKDTFRILGAQIIGAEGVDKRIDVLAAAMSAGMRAYDLRDLDLAYAPPYSSAKDPVNMVGFMTENLRNGLVKQIHWDELDEVIGREDAFLLDTRTPQEYAAGHIEGFVNIPLDELRDRLGEIDENRTVYIMCQTGLRSYIGCRILSQSGFDCCNISGGYGFLEAIVKDKVPPADLYPCGMNRAR